MAKEWVVPIVGDDELHHIERAILRALDERDHSSLTVLGLGELGLAIGWPTTAPRAVIKRQASGPIGQMKTDLQRMHAFHAALRGVGASILPTDIRTITNLDGDVIPYLIQPVIDRDDLVESILATEAPRPDHPILLSIRDTVQRVVRDDASGGLSIDAQVTNFAWNGETVVSLDTTPALLWEPSGGPLHDIGNYLTAVPAPLRPLALRLTKRAGEGYRTVRGVLELTTVYLIRIGQRRWVDPAMECFNEILDTPLEQSDVEATFDAMMRDLPMIKRLARTQRFWTTRIRRKRYEFFITNSFTGEIY